MLSETCVRVRSYKKLFFVENFVFMEKVQISIWSHFDYKGSILGCVNGISRVSGWGNQVTLHFNSLSKGFLRKKLKIQELIWNLSENLI